MDTVAAVHVRMRAGTIGALEDPVEVPVRIEYSAGPEPGIGVKFSVTFPFKTHAIADIQLIPGKLRFMEGLEDIGDKLLL